MTYLEFAEAMVLEGMLTGVAAATTVVVVAAAVMEKTFVSVMVAAESNDGSGDIGRTWMMPLS